MLFLVGELKPSPDVLGPRQPPPRRAGSNPGSRAGSGADIDDPHDRYLQAGLGNPLWASLWSTRRVE